MTHYKQIIINMSVEDRVTDQIREEIEKCVSENTDSNKIKDINVRLN